MQMDTSDDLLVYTNMFLKIQSTQTLASLDMNCLHRDSLTARCLCGFLCYFFPRSAFCQWFCSPSFTPGRIRFLVETSSWDVCDRVWCMLAARSSYLSHEERRRPIPVSTRAGSGRSARQWSNWALCTGTHTHDGHQRQTQLPFLLLNSRTAIIKCPPSPIKTNSLDCSLPLSVGLTDTSDCIIHPPLPHPLLTAPVSHTALAQSTEIVSCLFLNTHLYLTAYWVSISLNVHHVWKCSRACVCGCVCQLLRRVYVSSATCLSCLPLFPVLKVCLSIKQQGWREGVGAWHGGGGVCR